MHCAGVVPVAREESIERKQKDVVENLNTCVVCNEAFGDNNVPIDQVISQLPAGTGNLFCPQRAFEFTHLLAFLAK